jgi:hypothetical protein
MLNKEQRVYFRDLFRDARAASLADAEGFQEILFAVEKLGSVLLGQQGDLGKYRDRIVGFVQAAEVDLRHLSAQRGLHIPFANLYELVREGRNAALHQGAFARQLSAHATQLAIAIEDALVASLSSVGDFAIHHPVCASPWHPVSFVRQTMLANSFSYLPMRLSSDPEPAWRLISDVRLAAYLRTPDGQPVRSRMQRTIGDLVEDGELVLDVPFACSPDTLVHDALAGSNGLPILIVANHELIGIATPFDLL